MLSGRKYRTNISWNPNTLQLKITCLENQQLKCK